MTVNLYRENDPAQPITTASMTRVVSGTTTYERLLLRNDGEEAITSLLVWRADDDRLPGAPTLTAAGQAITATTDAEAHEVLSAPLAPGEAVPLDYSYSMAAEDRTRDTDRVELFWSAL